jgi:two-component system phosphate regulon sensor histidine kinase PhoR
MSFRNFILYKLLLAAILLILVALGSVAFLLSRYTASQELLHAEQAMEGQIRILGPALDSIDPASLAAWTQRAAEQSRARVTIVDRSGAVLADSQHDFSTMDNHAGRPEIRRALAGQTGKAVRHSATLDADLCYLAIPARLQGKSAVVLRLAVPLRQVQVAMSEIRWLILQSTLIAMLCALLLAYFLSRLFSARIQRIQAYARELVNADYSGILAPEPDDELGSVARSLRGMAHQFRQMLRRLSDEAALRKAILASMVEGVIAVDRDLRVTFCNSSFARAVNAREPLPVNQPLLEVVRDPTLLDLLKRVLSTGQPLRMRMTLGADCRVFEAQAAPIAAEPGTGAIAILHEITVVEHLERVRKDFVANISHDLRTPLAAIQGYAETLLGGGSEDQENNRKFLQIIRANAVRLGDLASDLLTLSELETECEPPREECLAVRNAAESVVSRIEEEAAESKVNVVLGRGPNPCIMGHPLRFERALLNLLRNAIKFNRPGGGVYLDTAIVEGSAQITVRDTGIGIPSAELPRIFERSYCVDKSRSRENGGTGLGLAIVKHIVGTMHGSITVESQLGKGTVFTLRFPVAPCTVS